MLKKILKDVVLWRLITLVIAVLAFYLIPVKDCCHEFGNHLSLNYLTGIWANFAGSDFLGIAAHGYGYPLEIGTYLFFPLFPWLIKEVSFVIPNYLASGLIISHFCFIFALYFLYKLVKLDFKDEIAKLTIVLLLIFPTSFFFGSVYTESFFLLVVVLSLYLVRKQYFFLACLLGLLASATRVAGIFLWPALVWEIWQKRERLSLVWLVLPPLGLLAYMKFLFTKTGDALFFLKVSPDFGPNLVINKLILLHQVFYRYAKMLVFSSHTDITYSVILLEFLVGLLFLVLTIFAFKYLRPSYAIFALLSYLIPTFTGTFASQPRYVLTIFPGFILLAIWFSKQSPLMKRFYVAINIIFGIIALSLFTRGYFVG